MNFMLQKAKQHT